MLISQNVTSQEFHQASRRGLRTRYFVVKNNIHNKGFFKNWTAFWQLALLVEETGEPGENHRPVTSH
jgi:hypothetical protein